MKSHKWEPVTGGLVDLWKAVGRPAKICHRCGCFLAPAGLIDDCIRFELVAWSGRMGKWVGASKDCDLEVVQKVLTE